MAKYTVIATWENAPHLSKAQRAKYAADIPPSELKARTEGLPHMGSGLIWPVSQARISIADFPLPPHHRRCFAFETGWLWNAAVFGSWDEQTDIVYIYSVYKAEKAEPPINADAILAHGSWLPGVADASDINRADGKQYIQIYKDLGLDVELPNKVLETGIQQVWVRLSTGRLRVFASCVEWFDEFNVYMRDRNGEIVKRNDHLLDATRYLIMSGLQRSCLPPTTTTAKLNWYDRPNYNPDAWMG